MSTRTTGLGRGLDEIRKDLVGPCRFASRPTTSLPVNDPPSDTPAERTPTPEAGIPPLMPVSGVGIANGQAPAKAEW